jgi:hypothetical protein
MFHRCGYYHPIWAHRLCREPYIASHVQMLHTSTTSSSLCSFAYTDPEAFLLELARIIAHFTRVQALQIHWSYGCKQMAAIPQMCWLQFGTRLTCLSIQINKTQIVALAKFTPATVHLKELFLLVEPQSSTLRPGTAQSSQSLYQLVSALVIPAWLSLTHLALSLHLAASYRLLCTARMITSTCTSPFCMGPSLDALAKIHFPWLYAFALSTVFPRTSLCCKEDAFLRIISKHSLRSLAILPLPWLTISRQEGPIPQYSAGYSLLLARAGGLQYMAAISQLCCLCLLVTDTKPQQISAIQHLCLLPSSLEELQLTGTPICKADLCLIIAGLSGLCSLRVFMPVDGLLVSLFDYLASHMSTIQELDLRI